MEMPISTMRAILKKFKATRIVINLPGRGPGSLFCPHTHSEEAKRGKKNPPRITVGELRKKAAAWGHQVSKTTICHLHANKLFGKPFLSFHQKCKYLEFVKRYWNFVWNCVLSSDETKIELCDSVLCTTGGCTKY